MELCWWILSISRAEKFLFIYWGIPLRSRWGRHIRLELSQGYSFINETCLSTGPACSRRSLRVKWGTGNELKLNEPSGLTSLQERLMRKLAVNIHQFYFQLPRYSAPLVVLNLSPRIAGSRAQWITNWKYMWRTSTMTRRKSEIGFVWWSESWLMPRRNLVLNHPRGCCVTLV